MTLTILKRISVPGLVVILFMLLGPLAQGQFQQELRVTLKSNTTSATSLLTYLEDNYAIDFRYKPEWLEGLRLSADITDQPLSQALETLFRDRGFTFIFREPSYVIFIQDAPAQVVVDAEKLEENQIISLGEVDRTITEATLTGQVLGGEDNEILQGVVVYAVEQEKSAVTDPNGRYRITLPVGYHTVRFQSVEFDNLELSLNLNSSSQLNINLYKDVRLLEGVEVTAEAPDENVSETITGVERIDVGEIQKQPALLGQADVIKTITSLAGVNVTGESAAGFNVRGSGVGANLILLDKGLIFNPSHLFGVFSSFNADVIGSVELNKGTIPSKYGGRIASVLDVRLKNGNKNYITGGGSIGAITSSLDVEVPVIKGKSSIVSSVRAAYPNYLLNTIQNRDFNESESFFGDFSFRYDHTINEKNLIFATLYGSNNGFDIRDEIGYDYNNLLGVVEWNRAYSDNFSSSLNYSFSQYSYTFDERFNDDISYSLFSVLENQKVDLEFNYLGLENHSFDFGVNGVWHNLKPGNFNDDETAGLFGFNDLINEQGLEAAVHVSDLVTLSPKFSVYAGLRYSFFSRSDNGLDQTYHGIEPRLSFNYRLDNNDAIKGGYNRMRQYIHLISNTSAISPIDIWRLSNDVLRPTVSDQFTLGYFRNFNDNAIEASIEAYYKNVQDLVDYRNGATLFGNPNLDEELIQGKGEAYGVELNVEKTKGKATGRVSYTYSRTFLQIAGENPLEAINDGEKYPTNFDQPHNLTITGNFQTSRRFRISANFVYNTGRPITLPESFYTVNGVVVSNFSVRNGGRIPDYHRLDLSLHLATTLKRKKNVEANWTLTLYNVYSRRNAYSVFFRTTESNRNINSFRLSIIGQIVPALSYTFKF